MPVSIGCSLELCLFFSKYVFLAVFAEPSLEEAGTGSALFVLFLNDRQDRGRSTVGAPNFWSDQDVTAPGDDGVQS